jgi:hypothetical protein
MPRSSAFLATAWQAPPTSRANCLPACGSPGTSAAASAPPGQSSKATRPLMGVTPSGCSRPIPQFARQSESPCHIAGTAVGKRPRKRSTRRWRLPVAVCSRHGARLNDIGAAPRGGGAMVGPAVPPVAGLGVRVVPSVRCERGAPWCRPCCKKFRLPAGVVGTNSHGA